MGTNEQLFRIEEWTIENFSCWNWELHDVFLSPVKAHESGFTVKLYPRGLTGQDKHLVVRLYSDQFLTFLGDVSFIGSDGSVLCKQQMIPKNKVGRYLELPPGPKFEDVVAKIKKNESLYGDRLTLKFRIKCPLHTTHYKRTEIDVFEASFKVSPTLLANLDSTDRRISSFQYPIDGEGTIAEMILKATKVQSDYSDIALTLSPISFKKNILVHTRMSVLSEDDGVIGTEENESIFHNGYGWMFSNSLRIQEVTANQFSLILYVKIIPSKKCKQCYGSLISSPKEVSIMPTKSFTPTSIGKSKKQFSKSLTSKTDVPNNSVTELTKELMCLYQDQEFSDFQLKCDSVSFPVHKNILSARSPVFKTMFSTDMKEAASGCMDIVDLEPSTLGLFLTYVYTGAVDEMQCDSALKLYYAADKYQVPSLKRECADFLSANVSISNVCDILSFANRHQDDKLTGVAHDFFLNNFNDVLASEEWKSFMRSEPLLAVETVTHFGEKKYIGKPSTF